MHTQKGFSLIEILITLIIVSIGLFGFADAELSTLKQLREIHQLYE